MPAEAFLIQLSWTKLFRLCLFSGCTAESGLVSLSRTALVMVGGGSAPPPSVLQHGSAASMLVNASLPKVPLQSQVSSSRLAERLCSCVTGRWSTAACTTTSRAPSRRKASSSSRMITVSTAKYPDIVQDAPAHNAYPFFPPSELVQNVFKITPELLRYFEEQKGASYTCTQVTTVRKGAGSQSVVRCVSTISGW